MEERITSDRPRPDMSDPSQIWLSAKEAAQLFFDLELPRGDRAVRRYCNADDPPLTCIKTENQNGVFEYRITKDSIEQFVAEQKSLQQTSGHARIDPEISGDDPVVNKALSGGRTEEDTLGQPVTSEPDQPEFLQVVLDQLKKKDEQLEKKDAQIEKLNESLDTMMERVKEGNVLLQNYQKLDAADKQLELGEKATSPVPGEHRHPTEDRLPTEGDN